MSYRRRSIRHRFFKRNPFRRTLYLRSRRGLPRPSKNISKKRPYSQAFGTGIGLVATNKALFPKKVKARLTNPYLLAGQIGIDAAGLIALAGIAFL